MFLSVCDYCLFATILSVLVNKLSLGKFFKRIKLRDWYMFFFNYYVTSSALIEARLMFFHANKKCFLPVGFSFLYACCYPSQYYLWMLKWIYLGCEFQYPQGKTFLVIIRNLLCVFLLKYLNGQIWRMLSNIVVNATRLNVLFFGWKAYQIGRQQMFTEYPLIW